MAHLDMELNATLAFAQREFTLLIKNELAEPVATDLEYLFNNGRSGPFRLPKSAVEADPASKPSIILSGTDRCSRWKHLKIDRLTVVL